MDKVLRDTSRNGTLKNRVPFRAPGTRIGHSCVYSERDLEALHQHARPWRCGGRATARDAVRDTVRVSGDERIQHRGTSSRLRSPPFRVQRRCRRHANPGPAASRLRQPRRCALAVNGRAGSGRRPGLAPRVLGRRDSGRNDSRLRPALLSRPPARRHPSTGGARPARLIPLPPRAVFGTSSRSPSGRSRRQG
jgi:hypothetical protein